MAISLLVLLVPVFLIIGIYRVLHGGDEPVVINPAPTLAEARAAGAFPVAEPSGLSSGWRPVSATFTRDGDGAVLRLGYLTPSGDGVQMVQSSTPAERLLPTELTSAARPEGTVDVGGQTWQRYQGRPGERALVLLQPNRTIAVVGSAPESDLRALASSVRS